MPKVPLPALPVSGLFGVVKPSGPTSMSVVNDIQNLVNKSKLFVDESKIGKVARKKGRPRLQKNVKIGQGGTLDPLADGVLVIGVGKGTKELASFLDCTKEYVTTCLLGCETDSYDSKGKIVRKTPWKHVDEALVQAKLAQFTGQIIQTPPIFSALKMDGMPLYEYARKGIPLPRPIAPRDVTVHNLEIVKWLGTDHSFSYPTESLSNDELHALEKAMKSLDDQVEIKDEPEPLPVAPEERPSAFVLKMKVSSGTYVRSIVHDLAHAVGSSGHVVTLQRSRQGRFVLQPEEEDDRICLPWEVFSEATDEPGEADEDGWLPWEREVIQQLEIVQ
ncbi:pseudouridylate synthase 4 [Hymenopellis radicata]|nr:pseudouridylate synthase 4 [Hymenopellis radicata]